MEQKLTTTHLSSLQSLVQSLKLSTTKHLLNNTWLIFLSILFVISGLACFVFLIVIKNIWPFYIINELRNTVHLQLLNTNKQDVAFFSIGIKAMATILGLLFLYLAMLFNNLRGKNNIIQDAAKKLNDVVKNMEKEASAATPTNSLNTVQPKDLPFTE